MKRFILLDTNTIYFASGITTEYILKNKRTKILKQLEMNKLREFISKNFCCLTLFSLYEIINGNKSNNEKIKMLNYIRDSGIVFITGENIIETKNKTINQLYNIYYDVSNFMIKQYADDFTFNIMLYLNIIIYLHKKYIIKRGKSLNYFIVNYNKIQKYLKNKINNVLFNEFLKLNNQHTLYSKNIKRTCEKVLGNLMPYYDYIFEYSNNKAVSIIKRFKEKKNLILKDPLIADNNNDFKRFNLIPSLINQFKEENPRTSRQKINKILIENICENIAFSDDNEYLNFWIHKKIESLLLYNSHILSNDIIDFYIFENLNRNIVIKMIGFDTEVYDYISEINDEKCQKSIKLINSFLK